MAKRFLCILTAAIITAACHERTPTAPTGNSGQPSTQPSAPNPTPSTPAPAPTPSTAVNFRLSGIVADDAGTPVPGARVVINFLTSNAPGTYYSQIFATTGANGAYGAEFTAVAGAMVGPAGTESAVAFAFAEAPPLDGDSRYVLATDQSPVQNFRLGRVIRITAGDSTPVTVPSDAGICSNDVQDSHPWPSEFICRSVHIVAPRDGVVTLEVTSIQTGGASPKVEVQNNAPFSEQLGNPVSMAVTAGTELIAMVELPWGSSTDASIVLKTSFTDK